MNDKGLEVPRFWIRGLAPGVLLAVGLLHSIVGFSGGWETLGAMAREGFWDTLPSNGPGQTRRLLLWFLVSGFVLMMLGYLGLWYELSHRRPLPSGFALALLVFALVLGVVSGGGFPAWLFAGAALYMLAANRAIKSRRSEGVSDRGDH